MSIDNFEDLMKELEEIILKLEGDVNLSLAESMKLYKRGIELYKQCKSIVEECKFKLEVVNF